CIAEVVLVAAHWSGTRSGVLSLRAFAKGGYRLLQPCRPPLAPADRHKCSAEIVLGLAQLSGRCARGASKRLLRYNFIASGISTCAGLCWDGRCSGWSKASALAS